jgi:hypothetical protein
VRALVVDMVGVVGLWVCGVVGLVRVVGLECVECVFVCGVRGGRVDCRVGVAGALGVRGVLGKKTLLPRGSFQNCEFQDGVNFVSKFMLKERSA